MSGAVPEPGKHSKAFATAYTTSAHSSHAQPDLSKLSTAMPSLGILRNAENIYDALLSLKKDFVPQNKSERSQQLIEVCKFLRLAISHHLDMLNRIIDESPPLDLPAIKSMNLAEKKALISNEADRENAIAESVKALNFCVEILRQQPVEQGKYEYSLSTGVLDHKPGLNAGLAMACSSVGLAASGILVWMTHHPLLELGKLAGGGLLFAESTVVIGMGTAGFAMAYGGFKAAAGLALRMVSKSVSADFTKQKEDSAALQNEIGFTATYPLNDIKTLAAKLPKFYERNNILTSLIRPDILSVNSKDKPSKQVVKLKEQVARLGISEASDIWQILTLERTMHDIASSDIRSDMLKKDPTEMIGAEKEKNIFKKLGNMLRFGFNSLVSIKHTSQTAGIQSALGAATRVHDNLAHMPYSGLDPFIGFGTSLSHALKLAVESGLRPEQALIDAVEMALGIVNFGQDLKHGPTWGEAVEHGLSLKEFRQGSKWRWFGNLCVQAPILVVKKPFILIDLMKLEVAKGNITSGWVDKEVEMRRGRLHALKSGIKEIGKIIWQASVGGLRNLVTEKPLKAGLAIQLSDAPIKKLIPFQPADVLNNIYKKKLQKLNATKILVAKKLGSQEELENLTSEEIKNKVIQAVIDFHSADSKITYSNLKLLINYWSYSERITAIEGKARDILHERELASLDPDLIKVTRNAKSKKFKPHLEKKYSFSEDKSLPDSYVTVLDCAKDGRLLILDKSRVAERIRGSALPNKLNWELNKDSQNTSRIPKLKILDYADEARIAVVRGFMGIVEPPQAKALIQAHYHALNGTATLTEQARILSENNFSEEILFGKDNWVGLYRLGIFGGKSPTEAEISMARNRLISEGAFSVN